MGWFGTLLNESHNIFIYNCQHPDTAALLPPQIAAWVMCTLLMVYAKVSIASVMRSQGRKSLLWTGGSTQFGAFIGAVLSYVMINHLHIFKDGSLCDEI